MSGRRWKLCKEFMKGNMLRYLGSIFAVLAGVAVSFLTPLILEETIDGVIGQKRELNLPGVLLDWVNARGGRDFLIENLWIMAAILVFFYILSGVIQYLRGRWVAEASESIAKNIRDRLYSHLQTLPYDYHVKAQTGDLIQRCTSDVETIRRFLSAQVVDMFRSVLMVVIASVIMLRMDVKMTLMSLILVPPLMFFAYSFFNWVRKSFQQSDEAEGKMSAVLQENLTGVRVVRAFGRQQYEVEKFNKANNDLYSKAIKVNDLLAIYWGGSDGLSMLQQGITLIYGVFLAAQGNMLVGELTVFVSYISMLLWPIRQLGRNLSDLGKSLVSLDRIDEILCAKSEGDDAGAQKPSIAQDIVFDHVGFSYEAKNPVLRDINFTAKQGETVAILGATGSGKSTLMLLLQKLYDVQTGAIRIGGVDVRDIDRKYLRSRVGLVLQEPFLYSRSVRDNIRIVKPDAPESEVFAVAETASAHKFIQEFENGYETVVGERGVTLSGGQKQRIAIARTLMKENDVLIFDDSLSAVDTETDKAIREALSQRRSEGEKSATTFIISHRLTTLSEADRIIVLQDGIVAQEGTHEELIHQEGLYKRVYNIQSALEDELSEDIG